MHSAVLHIGAAFRFVAVMFLVFVVMLVAANLAASIVIDLWPDLLIPENVRITLEHSARLQGQLEAKQAPYVDDWLGVPPGEAGNFNLEINERTAKGGHIYEDFTMFKPVTSEGKYVNFMEAGYRSIGSDLQGPWPADPDYYNMFFFGGSTGMGVGSDRATISRFLQVHLNEAKVGGREVRVYNFGRGSYFSTQEMILFANLLREGVRPSAAIFLDGLNDFYFTDGRPSAWGVFDAALQESARKSREYVSGRFRMAAHWPELLEFGTSLPVVRLAGAIRARIAPSTSIGGVIPSYKPVHVDLKDLDGVVRRYRENVQIIQAIANAYGTQVAFVIQPVPGYHYDLRKHIALDPRYGLGGHEKSGQGYPLLRASLHKQPLPAQYVIWAADIHQDFDGVVYMDSVHYTRGFSKYLAEYISDQLIAEGFFKRIGSKTASRFERTLPDASSTPRSSISSPKGLHDQPQLK